MTDSDVKPSRTQMLTDRVDQLEDIADKLERRLFDLENKPDVFSIPKVAGRDMDTCQHCGYNIPQEYSCTLTGCPRNPSSVFPLGLNPGG